MSRLAFGLSALLCLPVLAKPWQGVVPGVSSALDVFGKFGEPTKKAEVKGQTVLVYAGLQAIPGTLQAQFKLQAGSQTVARVDVYPQPLITAEAVEKSYGPRCPEGKPDADREAPCYVLKEADGKKRPYFVYLRLGLAVFFKDDGHVQSFAFLPTKE